MSDSLLNEHMRQRCLAEAKREINRRRNAWILRAAALRGIDQLNKIKSEARRLESDGWFGTIRE